MKQTNEWDNQVIDGNAWEKKKFDRRCGRLQIYGDTYTLLGDSVTTDEHLISSIHLPIKFSIKLFQFYNY